MFRDQTRTICARSTSSVDQDHVGGPSNYDQLGVPASLIIDAQPIDSTFCAPVLVHSPKLDAEQGLIHFFANNFTCSGANRGTNLFWVPDNFEDLLKDNGARYSVQSVGAMALARLRRSTYYYREAQKAYGLALLSLAESWRHGFETDQMATLIATLFLGFFEVLASDLSSCRQSWMTHLGGLGAMLTQRQKQVQSNHFSNQMLLQSRSQVILNALQTRTPVPAQFQELSKGARQSPSMNMYVASADVLLVRLATLQAQYWTVGATDMLLAELVTLDHDIDQWTSSVASSWTFISRPSEYPSELEWESRCDIYPKPAVAHVLNKMRAARIMTHDLVQQAHFTLSLFDNDSVNIAAHQTTRGVPTAMIQQLVVEICATIPIYYRPSYVVVQTGGIEDTPQLGTTYWLLWPLEVVGSMNSASLELTEWIGQCLKRIYETTGIVKAQLAAQRIQEKIRRTTVA